MSRAIRVAVGVAVQAGHTAAGVNRAAILGLVELLLRKGRDEQAKTFDLLGVEDAIKKLVVVVDGDQLALRYVAEVGTRGEIDWGREFGEEVVRRIEVEIEARKIAVLLFFHFIDF